MKVFKVNEKLFLNFPKGYMNCSEAYTLVKNRELLANAAFIAPKDERSNPNSDSFDPLAVIKEKI